MPAMPDRRVLQDGYAEVDLEEAEVHAIVDAICVGKQIRLVTRPGKRKPGEVRPEACVTRFTDPATGITRWAVESWGGSGTVRDMFKADHSTEAAALAEYDCERRRLALD